MDDNLLELYTELEPAMRRAARRHLSDGDEAEHACGAVYDWLERTSEWLGTKDRSHQQALILKQARREAIRRYRRSSRADRHLPVLGWVPASLAPVGSTAGLDAKATWGTGMETPQAVDLMAALKSLPPAQSKAIVLTVWLDFTDREAAEQLGVSRTTVTTNRRRGLANLRVVTASNWV